MQLGSTSDDAAALLPGHATANQGRQVRLYSLVWRWHFYAGLLVSPVILLMARTGALLIFQDRLERVLYPGTMSVTPAKQQASYEQQVAAAQAVSPPGSTVAGLGRDADPSRPTAVFMRMPSRGGFIAYVDPADGHVLGDNTQHQFFETVETLHRRVFLGPLGRGAHDLLDHRAVADRSLSLVAAQGPTALGRVTATPAGPSVCRAPGPA